MKRSWKQTGSLFMVVCMVLTMLPAVVLAETDARDSGAPMLQSGILPMGSGAVTGRLSIGGSVAVTDLTDNGNGSNCYADAGEQWYCHYPRGYHV